jgi:L,D-peptidoglycan transpeptidase YkuD (ErfK/YbiS/YcfS/YnhG family)
MPGQKRKQELRSAVSHPVFSTACTLLRGSGPARLIRIRRAAGQPSRGWLMCCGRSVPVALGRSGIRANKWEGDGATPRGLFRPLRLWWRGDRHPRPRSFLPVQRLKPTDAWCEDPASRHYNRPVHLSGDAPGDRLCRADPLYDYIVEIDHNVRPRVARRGSAVFLHLARDGMTPTAGCVALTRNDMRWLLTRLGRATRIEIG